VACCCALACGPAFAQDAKVRAERYEIEVAFEPERGFLRATAAVGFRAGQYVEAVEFELHPALKIQEVTDEQGRKLEFTRSGRLGSPGVLVTLIEPCGAEQGATLTFTYQGVMPRGTLDYITPEGILLRDESRWYPVLDLAAFTQNEMKISLPKGWLALASGERINPPRIDLGHPQIFRTSARVSSRAMVAFIAGRERAHGFHRVAGSEGQEGPAVRFFPTRREAASLTALAWEIGGMMRWFAALLGPYPRESLAFATGFPGLHGVMGYSAPGLLVASGDVVNYVVQHHALPRDAPEFLPHEIAHQWFPIEVTLASAEDGWLAEGLAEYLAYRYLEQAQPEAARNLLERALREGTAGEPLPPLALGLRLFATEDRDVAHAALYQRGMMVFRTLEAASGRGRVDAALRELYQRHRGRSASIADFQKICEEITRRELGWFFDYYIRGTEIPLIELRRLPGAPGEVAGEVVVRNVPPEFSLRVEMRLDTAKGPIEHSVATYGQVTPFTVTTAEPVTSITLDPALRILRRPPR
jgi:hypothetical protein